MSIKLPEPIANYFAATNAHNVDGMLALFVEPASVDDENKEWRGLTAVREWAEEAISKYRFTVEVLGFAEENGRQVVKGRVAGNFPGSPVDLRHIFTLAGNKITRLEIIP